MGAKNRFQSELHYEPESAPAQLPHPLLSQTHQNHIFISRLKIDSLSYLRIVLIVASKLLLERSQRRKEPLGDETPLLAGPQLHRKIRKSVGEFPSESVFIRGVDVRQVLLLQEIFHQRRSVEKSLWYLVCGTWYESLTYVNKSVCGKKQRWFVWRR